MSLETEDQVFADCLRLSGANDIERKQAIIYFRQGRMSGRFGADEWSALCELAPAFVKVVADHQKQTVGGLRQVARESGLSFATVKEALLAKEAADMKALLGGGVAMVIDRDSAVETEQAARQAWARLVEERDAVGTVTIDGAGRPMADDALRLAIYGAAVDLISAAKFPYGQGIATVPLGEFNRLVSALAKAGINVEDLPPQVRG